MPPPTTIHQHPSPPKKWTTTQKKAKIYEDITTFDIAFNSFFFSWKIR